MAHHLTRTTKLDIHFNTTSMTPADALGLVALLAQLFPGMASEEAPTAPLPLRHVPNATTAAALDAAERGEVTPLESIAALSDDDGPPAADAPTHDSDGLPWDERIHSANKAVTADGKWRKRRNVPDTVMAQVTAELRGSAPLASVPPAPPPSPPLAPLPPVVPAAPAPLPPPEAPAVEPVAPPPPLPLPVAAPVATGGVEAPDFQAFALIMQKVTGALSAGTLVQSEVDQFVSHAGVAQLRDLAGSKAARDVFDAVLSAKLGA